MTFRQRPLVPLLALLLATLALAGCALIPPLPVAPSLPDPSAPTPTFVDAEHAESEAAHAYGVFIGTVDQIMADSGRDPERLRPFVSRELYELSLPGFAWAATNGFRAAGYREFQIVLQEYSADHVIAFVCNDISQFDFFDAAGNPATPPGAADYLVYDVVFRVTDAGLIVDSYTAGPDDACDARPPHSRRDDAPPPGPRSQ